MAGLATLPAHGQGEGTGYRLSAGDEVEIRVFRHEDLSGKFTLGSDGAVVLQFVGGVKLSGLTPEQARQRIESLLADGWLRKPQVTVNVADFARNTITVTGQVNHGGAFNVPRNKPFTISQAIGMAGGFNTRANPRAVILKRGNRSLIVNIKAIHEDPSQDITLQDGDEVIVKESRF